MTTPDVIHGIVSGVIGDILADVFLPALVMLSPFALMAIPDPEERRRRVPGPVGPLGLLAAWCGGGLTARRIRRDRGYHGRHRRTAQTPTLAGEVAR